jgi:hypothetical protein
MIKGVLVSSTNSKRWAGTAPTSRAAFVSVLRGKDLSLNLILNWRYVMPPRSSTEVWFNPSQTAELIPLMTIK